MVCLGLTLAAEENYLFGLAVKLISTRARMLSSLWFNIMNDDCPQFQQC